MADTIVGWAVVAIIALWFLADRLTVALMWLDRHNDETDAIAAADHQEPTRAEVEAGWLDEVDETWLFPDPAFRDLAIASEQEVVFAASVLADLDDEDGIAEWLRGAS